jgi:hypothetical protein
MDLTPDPRLDPAGQLVPVRPRDDGWSFERQREFLNQLAACGSVSKAARAVGMSRESAYALRRRADARGFAQAWDAARALAVEHLTEVAWDRALEGEVRPVYYHGELVGETRHYDNRLLLALIAQNRAAAGPALASPELVAAVASDWDAARARVERGEALGEPGVTEPDAGSAEEAEALEPLPPQRDVGGREMGEAQQLNAGLYSYWWDKAGGRWLTDWPEPEDFDGEELWIDAQCEVLGPYDPDAPPESKYGPLPNCEWARTLTAEEEAGIECANDRLEAHRARRIEVYRRATFGIASAAERASIMAANGGLMWQGEESRR